MDLTAVAAYRRATTRQDLALAPGERFLAGGTWLFSEPNRDVTGLVDLSTMPWAPLEVSQDGLRIGATCTIAQLLELPAHLGWRAQPLFDEAAHALLASFKIWNEATVVGNVCRAYAAAAIGNTTYPRSSASANSGRCFETGSSSSIQPRSQQAIARAPVTGFVIE